MSQLVKSVACTIDLHAPNFPPSPEQQELQDFITTEGPIFHVRKNGDVLTVVGTRYSSAVNVLNPELLDIRPIPGQLGSDLVDENGLLIIPTTPEGMLAAFGEEITI